MFEFQLARELGMTRAELLVRMSGAEFAYWIAVYRREARDREASAIEARRKAQLGLS